MAQDGQTNKKETQEIIIRKKGEKDTKMTLEITGDKVLINGKPIAEFNEDGVTVNNRKMIVRDGDKYILDLDGKKMDLNMKLEELKELQNMKGFSFNWNDDNDMSFGEEKEYTFMGVNTEKTEGGAKINSVTKESPAEKAGLKKDDIIYKIEDKEISNPSDLSETIRAMKKGDKVKVYFLRDGKKKDEKITLGAQKNSFARSFSYSMPNGTVKSFSLPKTPGVPTAPRVYNRDGMFDGNDFKIFSRQKLGIKIRDTEEGTGVTVLEVETSSAAATAGLMKDDVITEIGGVKINTTDEAREQLHDNAEKNAYTIKARRKGSEMTFNIKIPKNLKTADL